MERSRNGNIEEWNPDVHEDIAYLSSFYLSEFGQGRRMPCWIEHVNDEGEGSQDGERMEEMIKEKKEPKEWREREREREKREREERERRERRLPKGFFPWLPVLMAGTCCCDSLHCNATFSLTFSPPLSLSLPLSTLLSLIHPGASSPFVPHSFPHLPLVLSETCSKKSPLVPNFPPQAREEGARSAAGFVKVFQLFLSSFSLSSFSLIFFFQSSSQLSVQVFVVTLTKTFSM